MVRNVALRTGNTGAKETLLVAPFGSDRFAWFSVEHDLDRARVWTKDPDLHVIADLVRTQQTKRVRMKSTDEPSYLVTRHCTDVKSFHHLLNLLFIASMRKGSKRCFDIWGDDSAEVCSGAMERYTRKENYYHGKDSLELLR